VPSICFLLAAFEKEGNRMAKPRKKYLLSMRTDQINKAEKKRQDREGHKALKAKILSIFQDQFQAAYSGNRNEVIDQISRLLHSQPESLPYGAPKKLIMLNAFVRNTLPRFLSVPVKQPERTVFDGRSEERARRYVEIKSKVASSFQLLKEQPQSQISLQSIGLTANELAFGAVAPASTDQERKEALFLAKAAGDGTAVSAVLLENFPKNPPTSKRRSNIVDALRALGKSDEVAKLLSEHGVIENTKTLEWSVLPPGWWNDSKYTDQITKNSKTGQLLIERLRYVDQLNPLERWRSQEQLGSDPYWVFVFPYHVVAECPTHGNAIYIIKGTSDWRNLLNRPKADLLKGFPDRVVRIMHSGDWQSRLRRKLREK